MPTNISVGPLVDLDGQPADQVLNLLDNTLRYHYWRTRTLHASVHSALLSGGRRPPSAVVQVALEALKAAVCADPRISLETHETEVQALTPSQRRHALHIAIDLVRAAAAD